MKKILNFQKNKLLKKYCKKNNKKNLKTLKN
jgi:hypothetical protein